MVREIKSMAELSETIKGTKGKLVVIDFFATWCRACDQMAPFVQELNGKYQTVLFVKIDVDNVEMDDAITKYDINHMPTFVFIKDDKQLDRLEGASKEKLEDKVKSHST